MAIKKDAYWFSHDSNAKDDPKSMKLIDQLGLEGYGIYWVLIETLRDQADYKYPLDMLPILARRYNTSGEKMKAVVISYGLFDVDEEDNFFSVSLCHRMLALEGHREQRRLAGLKSAESRARKLNQYSTNDERPLNERITSVQLVKKSKGEKSKEEKSKEKKSVDFSSSFSDDPNQILIQKWDEWKKFRNQLKKPYKTIHGESVAYNKLVSLASSNSVLAIQIIQQSMDNEWLGFFPLKPASAVAIPGEDIFDKQRRELKEARERRLAREAAEKLPTNGN